MTTHVTQYSLPTKETVNPIIEFLVYYIEQFAKASSLQTNEAYNILYSYQVIDYLIQFYDSLHTQGHYYVLADIVELLHEKDYFPAGTTASDLRADLFANHIRRGVQ